MRRLPATLLALWSIMMGAMDAPSVGAHPDFSIVVHGTDEHAPRRAVVGMAQSRDGFLWVVSDSGLSRFDGLQFVNLPNETGRRKSRVFGDPFGGIWVRLADQSCWRWGEGYFSPVAPPPQAAGWRMIYGQPDGSALLLDEQRELHHCQPGGPPRHVTTLDGPKDDLFPAPSGGAWFFNATANFGKVTANGVVSLKQATEPIMLALGDSKDGAWVATAKGLARWREDAIVSIPQPVDLRDKAGYLVPTENCDAVWLLVDRQAWYYDGERWRGPFGKWSPNSAFPIATPDQVLWLPQESGGLMRVSPQGEITTLGSADGLPALTIERLFADRHGGVWLALRRGGLAVVRPRRFKTFSEVQGLPGALAWTLAEDASGTIWVGSEAATLSRLNDNAFVRDEPSEVAPAGETTFSLAACRDGTMWAAGRGRVYRREEGTWQDSHWKFPGDWVAAVAAARAGGLWLAAGRGGLWRRAAGSTSVEHVHSWAEGMVSSSGDCLIEDAHGRVWASPGGRNLQCWDGESMRRMAEEPNGPGTAAVYALEALDDGTVWVATIGGGLLRWQDGHFTGYGLNHGLPDDRVVSLLADGLGFLWVGTRSGLARIRLTSFAEVDDGRRTLLDLAVFDSADGLPTRQFIGGRPHPAVRARDGKLWFATVAGVVVCDPSHLVLNTIAPTVRIETVRLNGRRNDTGDPRLGPLATRPLAALEIPPGPNLLEIAYTAPCLAAAQKVSFQHRLEGLDTEWVDADTRREVRYAALSPGAYRFAVRAANNDGVWCEAPATIAIVVHPYWWQTRGFQVGVIAAVAAGSGLLVWSIARQRHRGRLAKMQVAHATDQERARIAQDLHDDLGAALTEISMLATTAERGRTPAPFAVIGDKTRGLVEALDGIVWSVNPGYDSVASFVDYATGYARDFVACASLACRLDIAPDLPALGLAARPRHQLFLAFKEALNNVVRHAGATEVRLRMAVENGGRFVVVVEDNGRGFDPEHPAVGMGLGGMRNRLAALGGACVILSQPGAGTTVRLELPTS